MAETAKKIVSAAVLVQAALLLISPVVYGQGLTGSIDGTVKDGTGAILPGVNVTVSSDALIGGAQVRVTGPDGAFRFTVLPPGDYQLVFDVPGFQKVERPNLTVRPDRTLTIDQVLVPASVAESVTVVGETPVVDVRNTQVASTVDSTVIEEVPVARRFSDLLNVMPGVQNGLYTFSPSNAVYGSRVTDNVYTVDGVSFVDPQVQAPITDIPYDDIQEVQVSTSGQFAEFGSASGGVFNFITKSGSNALHGLGAFYLQNKSLTSNNVSDEQAAAGIRPSLVDHLYDGGANVGGPIQRDRLWFFGSYYKLSQDQSYSDFPVPVPVRQWQATGKFDGQLKGSNRLSVLLNYRDRTWTPFNFGFTTAGDPRTWIGIGWKNYLGGLTWTATPTSTTVLTVRGGFALFDLINKEPNVVPGTPVYTETTSGIISGGPTQTAGLAQRDRYEIKGDVSKFVNRSLGGSHELKAGYAFEAMPLDTERRDQADANYLRHQLLSGAPYRIQLAAGPGHSLTRVDHSALYVQDQWTLGTRLTLNLGLRYDHWNGSLGPDTYGGGPWFPPEEVPKQDDVIPLNNFAGRIGLAWDPRGDRRWAVKASYGRFYQRIAGTDIGVARANHQGSLTYDWIDRNGDRVYQPGEEGTLRADSRPTTFGRIDEDVRMPYTDAFNLGVEVRLGEAFALGLNGTFKRERDFRATIDLAKPFDTAYNAVPVINPLDGSPMTVFSIKPEFQALPPQNLLTNPSSPTELFNNYDGVEVVLRRRMLDKWQMQSSYSYGRSFGTVGTLFFDTQGSPYTNPNNLIFIEGDQKLDRRHMVKINGVYELPWGMQLSGYYQFLSGLPLLTTGSGGAGVTGATFARFTSAQYPAITTSAFLTVPVEPQGSRRFENQQQLDLRFQKRTTLWRTTTIDLMVDVFNVFNTNTVIRVETLDSSLANFLRPAEILQPRAARIGLRYNF